MGDVQIYLQWKLGTWQNKLEASWREILDFWDWEGQAQQKDQYKNYLLCLAGSTTIYLPTPHGDLQLATSTRQAPQE